MIKLATFNPEFFDNNGDQGNLAVISAHFSALNVEFEVTDDYQGSDFLLVGDCSIAVLNQFESELSSLLAALQMRLMAGKPTLLVGRSYEYFAPLLGIKLKQGERESKFVSVRVQDLEVFGYHNSTVVEPRLQISGSFIGTTFFGPLFAKNPQLLKTIASSLGVELKGDYFEESVDLANKVREATTF
jgi:CobQ-like glutamine amidotransferase family enzyme